MMILIFTGNETAKINDAFFRVPYGKDIRPFVNVQGKVLWDDARNLPFVMLWASKPIGRDEELIMHYGEDYWMPMAKVMMNNHKEYALRTCLEITELESRLGMEVSS